MKHVNVADVYAKDVTKSQVISCFEERTPQGHGPTRPLGMVLVADALWADYHIASQFAALYLWPGTLEPTIGKFIEQHPSIVTRPWAYTSLLSEQELAWKDGSPGDGEEAIRPDLLLRRPDGFWDIADLKTAKALRTSLTKDRRKRRRFVDYVNEGIAQLANYAEYFESPANRAHAEETLGVVVQNPALLLIVGNLENMPVEEVAEASRMLSEPYQIIDYDTLRSAFLTSGPRS